LNARIEVLSHDALDLIAQIEIKQNKNKLIELCLCFPSTAAASRCLLFVYYKEVAIGYNASQAINNHIVPIIIFDDFRYPNYSSAWMGNGPIVYKK